MIAYRDLVPNQSYLHGRILCETSPEGIILDLGAGLASYHHLLKLRGGILHTVDAHGPYVEQHKKIADFSFHATIQDFISDRMAGLLSVESLQYDALLMIDVIEHLDKADALEVLRAIPTIAERSIIFTPRGFMPQDRDNYGLGGDHWQTHRSGWEPEELEDLGYDVEVWRDFHYRPELDRSFDAIWAVR